MNRQDGQGLVEYALIIALVAIVVIAALVLIGGSIGTTFNNIGNAISTPHAAETPAPTATP